MKKHLLISYLVAAGDGISGGTRIHVECTKQWIKNQTFKSLTVWASNDGYAACLRNGVPEKHLKLMDTGLTKRINFWVDYGYRIIKGISLSFFFKLADDNETIIYCASDFWADFFPALIIHLRYRNTSKLVTPIYLFAPRIFMGYDGKPIFSPKLIIYYIMQNIMMFFARYISDAVFVTYQPDIPRLATLNFTKQPQFVIVGGIEFNETTQYVKKKKYLYDAIFVGRYHAQKGIYQLMDIWKNVVDKEKNAKLAILGNGDPAYIEYIENFIRTNDLSKNIFLLGFKDGAEKYKIFQKTKMYLNTNLYDAGGMATMEAMSCALPVVSFDFPNSRSMIGAGALWAKYLDTRDFSKQILKMFDNTKMIKTLGSQARQDMEKFDWSKTAFRINSYFNSL